ncbi:MAG: M23 family peptidase, partial [Cruoricaptor ignavus]|nr:M23 family peptidase [Cruoricaptor ignavus]
MKKLFCFLFFLLISISLFSQKKWDIRYYHIMVGQEAVLYADNNEFMPISTRFKFQLENMKSTLASDTIIVLQPKSTKVEIGRFSKENPYQKNVFAYEMLSNFGDVLLKEFDEDFIYELPFAKGKTQLVYQGYNGKLSHK